MNNKKDDAKVSKGLSVERRIKQWFGRYLWAFVMGGVITATIYITVNTPV